MASLSDTKKFTVEQVLTKISNRLSRCERVQQSHGASYLTMGANILILWGNNEDLRFVETKAHYNPKNFYFEFPLILPVFKELLLKVKNLTPKTIDNKLLSFMLELESKNQQLISLKIKKNIDEHNSIAHVGLKNITLFPHQKIAARINELFPRILCLDEMGLGKTIVALRTALYRLNSANNKRCLVISPNSIKNSVWAKEITDRTDLGFCIPSGGKVRREKSIKEFLRLNEQNPQYHFLIINYEMTYKYLNLLKKFVDGQMLIIDEVHYMKTANSQRTKAIFKMNPRYLLSMTGTPFDNRIEDIYPLAEYVCPIIFGGTFIRFKSKYCVEDSVYAKSNDGPVKRKVITGYKNLAELKDKLALISYRRRKKEVLDLPPKTYKNRLVSMTKDQWKYYEKMREECYVRITEAEDGEIQEFGKVMFLENIKEIEATANGILAKMLRLSQITDGYLTDFADKTNSHWLKNGSKLAELDDIVEQVVEGSQEKIVIWSRFVEVVEYLAKRYKKHNSQFINGSVPVSERARINDIFQKDNATMILVAQLQSCGVGMNFHRATVQVFYDKCFVSSSSIIQAEDRLHRIGMGNRCAVISLIARGTIDEHWEKILESKLKSSDEILDDDKAVRLTKADYLNLLTIKKGD